ncbi:hypothetical protein FBZ84_103436 [Azospirillum baldaniorum]|uniref:hypothetical protein n=1 Tax=Azospirillum baldaniorum TaxID=1064539 RepID=UPI0011A2243D|nr:hypothetical protein [Azospirillum baldaniorum]TWA69719.1 hypothetical protein FBZ84_103436 [Azospirillum baldaniorum]
MNAETDVITVSDPMPVIASLDHLGGHTVRITWAEGPRTGITEDVDLGQIIDRYRIYAPLADESFFVSGRLVEDGNVLRWDASSDPIEMAATTIEHLAQLAELDHMSAEQFRAWFKRHGFSYDAGADALGISRRLIAYYLSGEKEIPRTIALACTGYDTITRSAA